MKATVTSVKSSNGYWSRMNLTLTVEKPSEPSKPEPEWHDSEEKFQQAMAEYRKELETFQADKRTFDAIVRVGDVNLVEAPEPASG